MGMAGRQSATHSTSPPESPAFGLARTSTVIRRKTRIARKACAASGDPRGRRVLTGPPSLPFQLLVVVAFGGAPCEVEQGADEEVPS
jgi:hypothetical protein